MKTANIYLDEACDRPCPEVPAGQYVMLEVSDTGQGMDADTLSKIFDPFFTTKAEGKGTGLGLSTVYGSVRQSGGFIQVYSELGQGTTFKIFLPRVQEAVSEIPAPKSSAEELRGSETILVVEDEEILRESICISLKGYGYNVLEAPNEDEALLLGEKHPEAIHLLLTDVVMPKMNGRELAERLALLRPDMRVLYMTGYTENAIVHHGVLELDISFIQKPFRIRTLIEAVRQILDEAVS